MELRTYLDILRRRAALVLIPLVLVPVVAYVVASRDTKRYDATAEVLLKPNNPDEGVESVGGATQNQANPDRYVEDSISLVQSSTLAKAIAAETGDQASVLVRNVRASQKGLSNVMRVTYRDRDPARAAKLANAYASQYIESRKERQIEPLDRATDELQRSLDELEAKINDLTAQLNPNLTALQQAGLQAQIDANTERYQSNFLKRQDLLVDRSLKSGNAEIVQEAAVPSQPAAPRPRRSAALGGVLGLLVGAAAVVVAERLDDRIRSRKQVELELGGSSVVGELPVDLPSTRNPGHVAVVRDPSGPLSEAARQLRTSVQFLAIDAPITRLLVTSSGPGEGKTLVTANLAAAFARAGDDVVIVSGDLRLPRVEQVFPVPAGQQGLTDIVDAVARSLADPDRGAGNGNGHGPHHGDHGHDRLIGDPTIAADIDELLDRCLVPTMVPGLSILARGPQPHDPAELLGSPITAAVMARLAARADLVVVDTPPALAVTDALALSASVDAVLLVASAHQTRAAALVRAVRTLHTSPARFLGVVLNRAPLTEGYGYGYGTAADAAEPIRADAGIRRISTPRPASDPRKVPTSRRGS